MYNSVTEVVKANIEQGAMRTPLNVDGAVKEFGYWSEEEEGLIRKAGSLVLSGDLGKDDKVRVAGEAKELYAKGSWRKVPDELAFALATGMITVRKGYLFLDETPDGESQWKKVSAEVMEAYIGDDRVKQALYVGDGRRELFEGRLAILCGDIGEFLKMSLTSLGVSFKDVLVALDRGDEERLRVVGEGYKKAFRLATSR